MKNVNLLINNLKGIIVEILVLPISGKNAMGEENNIDFYVNFIKDRENQIRSNKYFDLIKPRFEKLMKALYIRIEKLKSNIPLDKAEIDSISLI
ncbi:MAG: hypothetical protein A2X18_12775 [Bacteroidetes bacterium GWF2_40_14]|nr:MAG: hypothetical protein A2X18_12775 [Bacteroidetes bacterium GWF2_40_14]